jgi:hypothetical protein
MDPKAGLPTCVPDTCAPHGRFKSLGGDNPAYGTCVCDAGYVAVVLRKSHAAPAVLGQVKQV